jgi:hypothetical protein
MTLTNTGVVLKYLVAASGWFWTTRTVVRLAGTGGAGGSGFAAGVLGLALAFALSAFFGDEFAADGDGEEEGGEAERADEDEGGDVHVYLAPLCEVECPRGAGRAFRRWR